MWANVLKAPAPPEAPPAARLDADTRAVAVIDANVIINGIDVSSFATTAVTVPEVLAEIRDERSRAFLKQLPFGIETKEPSEESLKAGEE